MSLRVKGSAQNKVIVLRKTTTTTTNDSAAHVQMTEKITRGARMRWMEGIMIPVSNIMLQHDKAWTGH